MPNEELIDYRSVGVEVGCVGHFRGLVFGVIEDGCLGFALLLQDVHEIEEELVSVMLLKWVELALNEGGKLFDLHLAGLVLSHGLDHLVDRVVEGELLLGVFEHPRYALGYLLYMNCAKCWLLMRHCRTAIMKQRLRGFTSPTSGTSCFLMVICTTGK